MISFLSSHTGIAVAVCTILLPAMACAAYVAILRNLDGGDA